MCAYTGISAQQKSRPMGGFFMITITQSVT